MATVIGRKVEPIDTNGTQLLEIFVKPILQEHLPSIEILFYMLEQLVSDFSFYLCLVY